MTTYRLNWLSKYRSEFMGIAALWVLSLHLFSEMYHDVSFPVLHYIFERGNMGVDIFLILSGMGLFCSFSKRESIKEFYKNRFTKVVLPWLIMSIPYWGIIYFMAEEYSVAELLSAYLGISFWTRGISATWYIQLVIVLYLAYPLLYILQKKSMKNAIIIIVIDLILNLILVLLFPKWYAMVDRALTRVPAFIIGSMIGEGINRDKDSNEAKQLKKMMYVYVPAMLLCFMLSAVLKENDGVSARTFYYYGAAGVAIILMVVLGWCFDMVNSKFLAVFKGIGKISLEVYLISVFIRNIVVKMKLGMDFNNIQKVVFAFFLSLIVLALSALIHRMFEVIR